MVRDSDTQLNLTHTPVRICPVCGTVNPAGPSETCPHLQLYRIVGIDESLVDILDRMAVARNQFREMLAELKRYMNSAVRAGKAEVVPAHKVSRLSDIDSIHKKSQPLILTHPELVSKPKVAAKKKTRKNSMQEAPDPRQLALLVRETPKGDA